MHFSQEDSLIHNQASIDRGLFRSEYVRTHTEEEKNVGNIVTEHIGIPEYGSTVGVKNIDMFSHLDDDGLPPKGARIEPGRVIIAKYKHLPPGSSQSYAADGNKDAKKNNYKFVDKSVYNRCSETGFVEDVILTTNSEGCRMASVKIRYQRIPEVGDKFSSRHGQKGVVGITYRQEDMPFCTDGTTFDCIINPHAIPSRMTIGHQAETHAGMLAAAMGKIIDGTPYQFDHYEKLHRLMHEAGYAWHGSRRVTNGMTGKMLDVDVFVGIIYYQKLKHMVVDKIHSRTTGPVDVLTRQPVEGRSRDGGLRFGEMERGM